MSSDVKEWLLILTLMVVALILPVVMVVGITALNRYESKTPEWVVHGRHVKVLSGFYKGSQCTLYMCNNRYCKAECIMPDPRIYTYLTIAISDMEPE